LPGSQYCWAHDPGLADQRRQWSKRGGEGKSNLSRAAKRLPKDLVDVRDALLRTLQSLEAGAMEPARAAAISAVSRAIVAVSVAADFELRLSALEQAAGLSDGRHPA
jgi:hypothetical protein